MATPLSNFPAFQSNDAEFVRSKLFDAYGASSFSVAKGEDPFSARVNHLQLSQLALFHVEFDSGLSVGFPECGFVRQIFGIEGATRYAAGELSGEVAAAGWTPVVPAGVHHDFEVKPHSRHFMLRIELDGLQRQVNALVGEAGPAKLEFVADGVRGNPAISDLRRRVFHFAFEFNTRGSLFSALAAAEVERQMLVSFLLANPHNYSHFLMREPARATTSTVRIVEEYIEANWDKPLDIAVLASIANVSGRTLFRQFRQSRSYSPAEFAKRTRLQRAFELLIQPDDKTTVLQVALRCGFQNQGHFANDYRLAFGELPSETLAQGRAK